LLPSEQLGIGGYATVRGYEERLENGDDGWLISNELRTPAIKLGSLIESPTDLDYLQGLVFFDYGSIHTVDRAPGDTRDGALSSFGAGLRYTLSRDLSVRFDYGYELSSHDISTQNSQVHIGVVASF
jgi:hemolysin activation/secretion protein